jgi:hypothetical protein
MFMADTQVMTNPISEQIKMIKGHGFQKASGLSKFCGRDGIFSDVDINSVL